MRYLLTLLMLWGIANAQPYTYHLRYDTVKFVTANNSEFVLKSSTRDSTSGVLVNIGGGITQFKKVRAISATKFVVGMDTVTITGSGGGGGGSGTLTNITATNNTGQTWTITNPSTTPNLSLALTSAAVGLGSVDNTSDASKPVSSAVQTALNLKANLASPTFTGTVNGITAAMVSAPSGSGTSTGTNTGDQTNISGNAATVTTNANLTGPVTSTGNATAIGSGGISNTMLANSAVANISGTNTGDNSVNSLYSSLVSNATHTGDVTGSTALTIANDAVTEVKILLADNTTDDATTARHGFLPKLPNNNYLFLNGIGGYTVTPSEERKILITLGSPALYASLGKSQLDITATVALTDGTARYIGVYISETTTITGVRWWQTVLGSYTADNYNGVGLYSVNLTSGDLTLVASSTDDGNIWKATANTFSFKAFTSTYSAAPGLYMIAFLYNSSAQVTAPSVGAYSTFQSGGLVNTGFTNTNVKLVGTNGGEATLVSSVATANIAAAAAPNYAALY